MNANTKGVGALQCSALDLKRTNADIMAYSKTRSEAYHKPTIILVKITNIQLAPFILSRLC